MQITPQPPQYYRRAFQLLFYHSSLFRVSANFQAAVCMSSFFFFKQSSLFYHSHFRVSVNFKQQSIARFFVFVFFLTQSGMSHILGLWIQQIQPFLWRFENRMPENHIQTHLESFLRDISPRPWALIRQYQNFKPIINPDLMSTFKIKISNS